MPYTVAASERTTSSGNENETKALLYLMSFGPDCSEIDSFIIDFFNDVTGANSHATKLWDIQSKNARSGPAMIGKELVTLYKNHFSDFSDQFSHKILFLGSVTNSVRVDERMNVFTYEDMKDDAKKKVRKGLVEECEAKSYVPNEKIQDAAIDDFLEDAVFVVASSNGSEYIKSLVPISPILMPPDRTLEGIFNEIRDKQSIKKNRKAIEGLTIAVPSDAFNYCRHLKRLEIERFILSRIVNGNPFHGLPPRSFREISDTFPPEDEKSMLEDCQLLISKQMFDKNSAKAFWQLFEAISAPLLKDRRLSVDDLYASIDDQVLDACRHLDTLSTKYFIATIKDGLQ